MNSQRLWVATLNAYIYCQKVFASIVMHSSVIPMFYHTLSKGLFPIK